MIISSRPKFMSQTLQSPLRSLRMHLDNIRVLGRQVATPAIIAAILVANFLTTVRPVSAAPTSKGQAAISYHKQIWPILQAKCQGCHQPASPGGKLVVTTYAGFLKGGEHGAGFVAGKPDSSSVLDY